jgi:predicted nucleotidyltransferase
MSKAPGNPEEIFQAVIKDYQTIFGSDLLSIILYGSGARGEYIPQKSDINFLILLTENGIDNLSKALEVVSRGHKSRVSTPLFLTKNYIQASLDVFPIEFLNLKSYYKVICGEDVLQALTVKKEFLRLQCEREIKGKLLQLRQQFLETKGSKREIENLLAGSAPTFYSIFRALLFLQDKAIPSGSTELLSFVAQETGLNSSLLLDILKIKEGSKKLATAEAVSFMEQYIEQIKKLSAFIDEMKM